MVVREAVGDRSVAAHEQSLFDLEAKYADVVSVDETLQYLRTVGHNAPPNADQAAATHGEDHAARCARPQGAWPLSLLADRRPAAAAVANGARVAVWVIPNIEHFYFDRPSTSVETATRACLTS